MYTEPELFNLIEILGSHAFSISGVLAAMKKKLDVFSCFTIALITAVAGVTILDVIIGDSIGIHKYALS